MEYQLEERAQLALCKAMKTDFPFAVTGFLLDPSIVGQIAFGRVFRHVKADPVTGRFTDGHLMYTSRVTGFLEYDQVVLVTLNSLYVCVFADTEESLPISAPLTLSTPNVH